ncbi:MAG: hypothetical protein PF486_12130, partial [Prolixibacteraceae bacterium]|nr:hypothetical protein [Prolixibacteraceae bacterium]
ETAGTSSATAPTPATDIAGSESYFVSQTENGCESERAEIVVEVNPTPPAPDLSSNGPVCVGETLTITDDCWTGMFPNPCYGEFIPQNYSWTGPDNFSDDSDTHTISIANAQEINSGTYSVNIEINGCVSELATIDVVVMPPPSTPAPTSNSPVCVGDNIELSTDEVIGATYIWTGPDGFSSADQNPIISSTTLLSSGTYELQVQIGSCISSVGSVDVTVNENPSITFPAISPLCVDNASITLSASATPSGGTGTFSGNGVSGDSFDPSIADVGTHTITYDYSINGCSDSETIDITVQDKPTVDFTLPNEACAETALINMNPIPSGGSFTSAPALDLSAGFNPALATPNQEYSITYTYDDGVCDNEIAKSITVYDPQKPIGTNASEVYTLITDQASVPEISATGSNIVWYNDVSLTSQVGIGNTYQADETLVISGGEGIPGTYTFYAVEVEGSCLSEATAVTLTITDCSVTAPTPVNTLVEMCFGDSDPLAKTLDVTATAGNDIIWYFGGTEEQNSTSNSFVPTQTAVGTYQFEVSQYDNTEACESPRASITLKINPLPSITFNPPSEVCEGSSFIDFSSYKSQTDGIVTCLDISSQCTGFDPTTAGTYNFKYVYTNPTTLCADSSETQIIVRELPLPVFSTIDDMCEYDSPVDLTSYVDLQGGTFSGDGVVGDEFNPALVVPNSTSTISYLYSDGSCENTVTSSVTVYPRPSITFSDMDNVCLNDDPVDLSQFVTPIAGTFSGTNVSTTEFTPTTEGTIDISYEVTENGCSNTLTKPIVVNPLPTVTLSAPTVICHNEGLVTPTLSPGGQLFIDGNPISDIDPSAYTPGNYTLSYEYTNPTTNCTSTSDASGYPIKIRQIPTPSVNDKTVVIGSTDLDITATGSGGTLSWTDYNGDPFGTGTTISHSDASTPGSWQYCVSES